MKTNKWLLLIVQTALLLALTLIFQTYVRELVPAGIINTLVVGSLVNLCLYVASGTVGWRGSTVISVLTPVVAALMGHLPTPVLIPFVAAGNVVLCLAFELIAQKKDTGIAPWIAVGVSAAAKTAVLYALVVWIFVGMMLPGTGLPSKIGAVLSLNFSWPQLVTALIGGIVAMPVISAVKKALDNRGMLAQG
jgi:hypothetical protein